MRLVEKRLYLYLGLTTAGCALCILISLGGVTTIMQDTGILLIAAALVTTLLATMAFQAYRGLKAAQLIVDNLILYIRPAFVGANDVKSAAVANSVEVMDVVVSGFGILMAGKVIKFNQDGVRLKTLNLGKDQISLTYGADDQDHTARVLHEPLCILERERIARKFRSETGVIPKILD